MTQENLELLLNRYQPDTADELQLKSRALQFLRQYPNCCERELSCGHFTGSAWVLHPSGSKALLCLHTKLGKWLQLGGHADGERDLLAVALREVREESGLERLSPLSAEIFDLDIHEIPPAKSEPPHFHYDVRFLVQAQDENLTLSSESRDLAWVSAAKIPELSTEKSILRMLHKWQRRQTQLSFAAAV